MVKPLVGIDLDGCLADFNSRFLRVSRKLLGKPEKGFVVKDFLYENSGWSKEESKRVIRWMQQEEDFWMSLERLPNTSQLTKRERELEYFFITSRFSTAGIPTTYQSESWLRQQYGLKAPFVIVSHEKGKEAVKLDLTHFLDDRVENCIEVKDALPSCQVSIMDTTWNQHLNDSRILRVTNFNNWLKEVK